MFNKNSFLEVPNGPFGGPQRAFLASEEVNLSFQNGLEGHLASNWVFLTGNSEIVKVNLVVWDLGFERGLKLVGKRKLSISFSLYISFINL